MSRSKLRSQIHKAWKVALDKDYARQRINSERSLQASVWSKLNGLLPARTRRMFIEPGISCGPEIRYPDIVICNTRKIIAIIELKFTPRASPKWSKDIKSFQWMIKNRSSVFVSNVRHRGIIVDSRKYTLAKDVLFVWAGVHVECETVIKNNIPSSLHKYFLELHAETNHDMHASFR